MAISLTSILGSLENLIHKNNTISSSLDISANLNKRVMSFYKGSRGMNNKQPVPRSLYPAVFIEIGNKTEEFITVGNNAKRDMNIEFDIVPVIDYGIGVAESREKSDLEIITLSQNIESLIRSTITLSGTVHSALILNSSYDVELKADDVYVSVSRITILTKLYNQR